MRSRETSVVGACVFVILTSLALVTGAAAQPTPAPAAPAAKTPAETAKPPDPLDRQTPRGAVRGFLSAARKGETEVARQYLDTRVDVAAGQGARPPAVRGARREAAGAADADQR